jgi:hypothetical protein
VSCLCVLQSLRSLLSDLIILLLLYNQLVRKFWVNVSAELSVLEMHFKLGHSPFWELHAYVGAILLW